VSDLAAFLAARLDEDDRIAKGLMGATRFMGGEPDFTGQGGPAASAFWQHFASYRMVTEVAAKRAILARHQPRPLGQWQVCGACCTVECFEFSADELSSAPWPCADVRHLAAVYSCHPDYDPAWAGEPGAPAPPGAPAISPPGRPG